MKNIESFKKRKVYERQEVEVYRNLKNGKFSIRCKSTGYVLAHGDDFYLTNVRFTVNEKARERVLQTKQRNVHAYAEGYFTSNVSLVNKKEVTYQPYKKGSFYLKETGEDVVKAESIHLYNKKMYIGE